MRIYIHGARTVILHRLIYAFRKAPGDFVHIIDLAENLVSYFGIVVNEIFVKGTIYHCHKFFDKVLDLVGNGFVLGRKAFPLLLVGQRLKAVVGNYFLLGSSLIIRRKSTCLKTSAFFI